MSFRGRGRGRGGFGGGSRYVKELPFEPFPEIEGLGTAQYSTTHIQLVRWSTSVQKDCHLSPYYYEDRSERPKRQKLDIERYSDRQSQATKVKPQLWDVIYLDTDHMPAELARGGVKRFKKLKWSSGDSEWNKFEQIEERVEKRKGDGTDKKEDEDDEEELVGEEDEGEFSDEGDYEQAEDCDDDDLDYNLGDDNDDEPCY